MTVLAISGEYTDDWPEIANRIKTDAGWECVRCHHPHDYESGYVLTVHHFDGNKSNNRWWNLLPLCQRCHLKFHRVIPDRPWVLFEHSEWFKPYVGGFYAWKYLGLELAREQVEQNLEWYSTIEKRELGLQ